MFWKRKDTQVNKEVMDIARMINNVQKMTTEDVIRRFLMDCRFAETQQLSTLIGLPPLDPDRILEEQADSDERLRRASFFTPFVAVTSGVLVEAVIEYLNLMADTSVPEETIDSLTSLINRLVFANAVGTVTQLEDLGLIQYTDGKVLP